MKRVVGLFAIVLVLANGFFSCSKDSDPSGPGTNPPPVDVPFDIETLSDTYSNVAPFEFYYKWGPYNVHDPSILKDGEYYYSYSTDAGFGIDVRAGIQIRKSKDLVDWDFVGWVFDTLPKKGSDFIKQSGGTPFNSLWAPYILKVGTEYRLYYSLSSAKPRLSVIGLATASSPLGPWTEKGLVVVSKDDNSIQTNAIDPSVVVTPAGEHWFYYGSAWDGIYILKLNPATGLANNSSDKGTRIAQRGFTGESINGNIEGPEIIFNEEQNKYYLFIAYDWLQTKYNVRVGRSDSPQGPFLDFNGKDLNESEDNLPMILAPYKFRDHGGWQGTSHVSVFESDGQYFMAHQGRPGVNSYYMVMHVRKIFWTADGWPVVSPERYAATAQTAIPQSEISGAWEQIFLGYKVVPGYANEQLSPDFQMAVHIILDTEGTINGDPKNTWTYNEPNLTLTWNGGETVDKVIVERGRDWENKKACLIFTGLNNQGTAIWGKK
jgi:arabinan endo-1,5-alpha-L-arabinosidase